MQLRKKGIIFDFISFLYDAELDKKVPQNILRDFFYMNFIAF
jgi:hypothetical protein